MRRSNETPNRSHSPETPPSYKPLHRLREVRKQEGMQIRTVARRMAVDEKSVRQQEICWYDLKVSELRRWQSALDVPISELLVEPTTDLSPNVRLRSQLVRLMKTALSIKERTRDAEMGNLADRMIFDLTQLMPELDGVSSWPKKGRRRTLVDLGRICDFPIRDELLLRQLEGD